MQYHTYYIQPIVTCILLLYDDRPSSRCSLLLCTAPVPLRSSTTVRLLYYYVEKINVHTSFTKQRFVPQPRRLSLIPPTRRPAPPSLHPYIYLSSCSCSCSSFTAMTDEWMNECPVCCGLSGPQTDAPQTSFSHHGSKIIPPRRGQSGNQSSRQHARTHARTGISYEVTLFYLLLLLLLLRDQPRLHECAKIHRKVYRRSLTGVQNQWDANPTNPKIYFSLILALFDCCCCLYERGDGNMEYPTDNIPQTTGPRDRANLRKQ